MCVCVSMSLSVTTKRSKMIMVPNDMCAAVRLLLDYTVAVTLENNMYNKWTKTSVPDQNKDVV